MGSALQSAASTHGVDLLQLQAGITGQFSCAEQQSIYDIRAELLMGTALLAGGFGGVQHLHECIQAGQGAAEAGHGGRLGRAQALRFQPSAVGCIAPVHAGQQRGQQIPGIIEQGFDALGDVGGQQVSGFADQGVQLGNKGRADMMNLLADGGPPADARWRTVRVGVPETQQLKREEKTPADSDESPRTIRRNKAADAFSMMSRSTRSA